MFAFIGTNNTDEWSERGWWVIARKSSSSSSASQDDGYIFMIIFNWILKSISRVDFTVM